MNYSLAIMDIMIKDDIMMNNNLDINLNPMVPVDSINYKEYEYRESFPYELRKIRPKMLQRSEVEMMMMMVLMMKVMVMMIPMKSSSMAVTMAMISPSPGGISPADFCLPESFLLSGVFRPAAAVELFSKSIFRVFPPGR